MRDLRALYIFGKPDKIPLQHQYIPLTPLTQAVDLTSSVNAEIVQGPALRKRTCTKFVVDVYRTSLALTGPYL